MSPTEIFFVALTCASLLSLIHTAFLAFQAAPPLPLFSGGLPRALCTGASVSPLAFAFHIARRHVRGLQTSRRLVPLRQFCAPRRVSTSRGQTYLPSPFSHSTDQLHEQTLSVSRMLLHGNVAKRLLITRTPGGYALFCAVPGVASEALRFYLSSAGAAMNETVHPLSAYAPRDRERFLVRRDVYRFTFVRHPLARVLSVFYNGVDGFDLADSRYREFMGHVRGHSLQASEMELQRLTLPFFLTFVGSQRRSDLWERFALQKDLCGIGFVDYTLIGRLERFKSDLESVQTRLKFRTINPLHHANRTNASVTASSVFRSRRMRTRALRVYGEDIHALGYENTL